MAALVNGQDTEVEALIDKAFDDQDAWKADLSKSPKYEKSAIASLKKYRQERLMAKIHQESQAHAQIRSDIPEFLQSVQAELEEIECIGSPQAQSFLPRKGDWDKKGGIGVFSTGLHFFDKLLNGGHAPKEVYGVMGPSGSCKTTMAVMLAVEACKQAADVYEKTGKMEYVFVVSYEAALENELRFRAISYAAKIRRDSLENMDPKLGRESLSTRKTLKDYEKKMFKAELAEGEPVLGEQARLNDVMDMLNRHMIVLDMTGADPARRNAGGGYVQEIAAAITAELHHREPVAASHAKGLFPHVEQQKVTTLPHATSPAAPSRAMDNAPLPSQQPPPDLQSVPGQQSPVVAATAWYYDHDGRSEGPFAWGDLATLAKAGLIGPTTTLRSKDGKRITADRVITFDTASTPSSASALAGAVPAQAPTDSRGYDLPPPLPDATPILATAVSEITSPLDRKQLTQKIQLLRHDIVQFVLGGEPGQPSSSLIGAIRTQHAQLQDQIGKGQDRVQQLSATKARYGTLEGACEKTRKELAGAESQLEWFAGPLGHAAFQAYHAGEVGNQPCFADRIALQGEIESLQKEHDQLAPPSDASFLQKTKAKAQQLVVAGKIKIEELKIGSQETQIGKSLLDSGTEQTIACATTAALLDQVSQQRTTITKLRSESEADHDELLQVVGHEFSHVKCGHTSLMVLLGSSQGVPVPGISHLLRFVFLWWSRKAEYTADRGGLIACRNLRPAVMVLCKLAVGPELFKKMNVADFLNQQKDLDHNQVATLSETLIDHPYTVKRIYAIQAFRESPEYSAIASRSV